MYEKDKEYTDQVIKYFFFFIHCQIVNIDLHNFFFNLNQNFFKVLKVVELRNLTQTSLFECCKLELQNHKQIPLPRETISLEDFRQQKQLKCISKISQRENKFLILVRIYNMYIYPGEYQCQ